MARWRGGRETQSPNLFDALVDVPKKRATKHTVESGEPCHAYLCQSPCDAHSDLFRRTDSATHGRELITC